MASNGPQRWMIVGASGLVGSHLRLGLRRRDVIVTSYRTSVPGAVPLDLTDTEAIARAIGEARPDVVLVAAADAYVERCEREPLASRMVNVTAVRDLAAEARPALLVVFSSEYVFDGQAGSYGEDDPVAPLNEYGRQKVELETLAREHGEHLICRVSGVYGWSPARTSFVAQMVDALRAGRRFSVPSDQLITPTPAPDLARAVVELVERGARGTFHVAGPEILERPDFARRAAAAFDLDARRIDAVPTASLGLAARRPLRAGLRTEKLSAFLGHDLPASTVALAAMRAAEPPA